jgi:hypothetical protein
MDGTKLENHIEERRHDCLLMSFGKVQKLMRKTRRNMGSSAKFYVIDISPLTEQPAKFQTEEGLIA